MKKNKENESMPTSQDKENKSLKRIEGYEDYEYDLFIAYSYDHTINEARELYKKIIELYPNKYKIFFFPETHTDSRFDRTPDVVAFHSKAFLLVGSKDDMDLSKNALGEEVAATYSNEFMCDRYINGSTTKSVATRFCAVNVKLDARNISLGDKIITPEGDKILTPEFIEGRLGVKKKEGDDKDNSACILANTDNFALLPDRRTGIIDYTGTAKSVAAWLDEVIGCYAGSKFARYELKIGDIRLTDYDIYWVGTRDSDIAECEAGLFKGTICLFGKDNQEDGNQGNHRAYCADIDSNNNRIDHNRINDTVDMWVYEQVRQIAESNPKARFYCYNQGIVSNTVDPNAGEGESKCPYNRQLIIDGKPLRNRFICLNDDKIVNEYAAKDKFRKLCDDINKEREDSKNGNGISVIPCVTVQKDNCNYAGIIGKFREDYGDETIAIESGTRFVIQAPVGSGGESTFILEPGGRSIVDIEPHLKHGVDYICTVYQENNVPVNLHALIFNDSNTPGEHQIWLSTPSIQLLRETGRRLLYRGADFIECRNINKAFLNEFMRQARLLCEQLAKEGYRGVCGIDAIICDANKAGADKKPWEHVFMMELNARFQASTGLLNRALVNRALVNRALVNKDGASHLPTMQQLNLYAFYAPISLLNRHLRNLGVKSDDPKADLDGGRPFANIKVNYSNMSYVNGLCSRQARHLLQFEGDKKMCEANYIVAYELDGLKKDYLVPNWADFVNQDDAPKRGEYLNNMERDAYLYRIVFNTNLCWINNNSTLYFNENIIDETIDTYSSILNDCELSPELRTDRMLRTKVALLIQGVNLTDDARKYMKRPGTFQSIDIVFRSKKHFQNYVVNAPVDMPINVDENENTDGNIALANGQKKVSTGIKFTRLTPFCIDVDDHGDGLVLKYYGSYVDDVMLMPEDELWADPPQDIDAPIKEIAYLSTDRLRVHLTNACKYKCQSKGCKFCGISIGDKGNLQEKDKATFSKENVAAVVKAYVDTYKDRKMEDGKDVSFPLLKHFLVGGQTADLSNAEVEKRIVDTVSCITNLTKGQKDIYAMIVPCSLMTIERMKQKGLKQLAFNLEIWDDDIARQIMPGKRGNSADGGFTRDDYLSFLNAARMIMGKHESVRSMLMVGLEPMENTKAGVAALLKRNVQPMLSIFRPMPNTVFKDYMSPQIEDVVALYYDITHLCNERFRVADPQGGKSAQLIHLGPNCKCCQNNTVALPYDEEK